MTSVPPNLFSFLSTALPPHVIDRLSLPDSSSSIRFLSINVNKANYISHALLNSLVESFDVILVQEPWVGKIGSNRSDSDPLGTEVTGMVHQRFWTQFVPLPPSPDASPRVVTYVNKSLNTHHVSLHSDIFSHPDVLLEFSTPSLSPFFVLNVYNDSSNTAVDLISSVNSLPSPVIVIGDFNLHHVLWSGNEDNSSANADRLTTFFADSNISLLNTPGEVTFERGGSTSVLDLGWASSPLLPLIRNWTVHHDLDFASDHLPIALSLFHSSQPPPVPSVTRFSFKDDHSLKWNNTLDEIMRNAPACPPVCDPPTLLNLISFFNSALETALLRHCKSSPPKSSPSPWFTPSVSHALVKVRCAKRCVRRARRTGGIPFLNASGMLKLARAQLRRIIRKAKWDWATQVAQEIEPTKIWSLTNWFKGIRRYGSPSITHPDGTLVTSPAEKADLFLTSFFPPPPLIVSPSVEFTPDLRTNVLPFAPINELEIQQHLRTCSNSSAPGPSGITYRALKWAWTTQSEFITYILQWSLELGLHHPDWKHSICVVIPKPGKPSYSSPRSFRPIQLIDCLGKLLEKVVAKRISFNCSRLGLIPPEQFGRVSSASAPDAGLVLSHDVTESLNRGLSSSLLTLDVKGYFDSINHGRLLAILYDFGFPRQIVQWVASFLSMRRTSVLLETFLADPSPISTGVPQGSPISPVLSIVYSAPILHRLRQILPVSSANVRTSYFSYIDDFSLLASSSSVSENAQLLTDSFQAVQTELAEAGLTLDVTKTELIHFSRSRSPPCPSLHLSTPAGIVTISPKPVLRWLGIFFDSKLSFKEHVRIMVNRAKGSLNGLCALANTVRGLHQSHLLTLVKTCILPILTYAFQVWYRPDRKQAALLDSLNIVLNRAARLVSGAFRTSPALAIRSLAHVPNIIFTLDKLHTSCASRLRKLPMSSMISQRLPDDWRLGVPGDSPFPTLPHLPHTSATTCQDRGHMIVCWHAEESFRPVFRYYTSIAQPRER